MTLKTQTAKILPQKFFASRAPWRAWLKKHHASSTGVWVRLNKKHVGQGLQYAEAVEEALCFGWIDGQLRRIDDRSHMVRFTPRRAGSIWAPSNIARMKRLIKEGRMTPAGRRVFKPAEVKRRTAPTAAAPTSLRLPPDLAKALRKSPKARKHFLNYPPSHRRIAIWWVRSAKHPETRERRIRNIVQNAAAHSRAGY